MLSFSGLGGLRASPLEALGLHDTNLNTLSTRTPKLGAKNYMQILKKSGKSKLWPYFSSSLMKRITYYIGLHMISIPMIKLPNV